MIFFIVFHGLGQSTTNNSITSETYENTLQSNGSSVLIFNNAYDGIKGTPYLSSSWSPGGLIMRNGAQYKDLEVKYDMLEDNVLVKDKTGSPIFLVHGSVSSFQYHDELGAEHKFINLSISDNANFNEMTGFFEILFKGNSSLYMKRSKYLKHVESLGAYSSNKSYDEFRDNPPEYFLINNEEEITKFYRGKKSLLNALNDDGSLATYVKKKKRNLKKDEDIILLMEYYNSL